MHFHVGHTRVFIALMLPGRLRYTKFHITSATLVSCGTLVTPASVCNLPKRRRRLALAPSLCTMCMGRCASSPIADQECLRHAVPFYWGHTGRYMSTIVLETLAFQITCRNPNGVRAGRPLYTLEPQKTQAWNDPSIQLPQHQVLLHLLDDIDKQAASAPSNTEWDKGAELPSNSV